MYLSDKFDWETRNDAETIARYQEIKANPERLNKAKSCIKSSVIAGKKALGEQVPNIPSRGNNRATITRGFNFNK